MQLQGFRLPKPLLEPGSRFLHPISPGTSCSPNLEFPIAPWCIGGREGIHQFALGRSGCSDVDWNPIAMALEDRALPNMEIAALQELDTCIVSDAIETFDVRLRNTGFADSSIHCMFEDFPPMVGYAATARLRTDEPPIVGRTYHDRADWWNSILQVPAPRIAVVEDIDKPCGVGAFMGDLHAAILMAFGCVGYVSNGAVRKLPWVRELGFNLFAGNVAVSHAYAHLFDFGTPVQIGGMVVNSGDLLHGDRHGLLHIPKEIAAQIPLAARKQQKEHQKIVALCRSNRFSVERLRQALKALR
jgi:4-hydroxy-4-methyl-2-oxoglutarate aldolase